MLRQGVWCRSTLFTLGMGSDIRLRSSPVLWTETSSTPLCRSLRARRTDIRRHAVAKSVVEQRAFSRHASAAARLETSHAVAALEGNVRLVAQRKPHLTSRDAGIQRLRSRAVPELRVDQICDQRTPLRAELVSDGAIEFASTHRGVSQRRESSASTDATRSSGTTSGKV